MSGKTRIILTASLVGLLFAWAIVYSNWIKRNSIVGGTEASPASDVRVLLNAVAEYRVIQFAPTEPFVARASFEGETS
jgi:hypothetical protein